MRRTYDKKGNMKTELDAKTIAYLSTEIPSISTTFVYNEILSLEENGFTVIPIALHPSRLKDVSQRLRDLSDRVIVLYQNRFFQSLDLLAENCINFIKSPAFYLKTLELLFTDIQAIGIIKKDSLKLAYHFLQAAKVSSALRENNCCHIHAHFAGSTTQIAMYASSISGVPFSFTSHAADLFSGFILLKEKIDRSKTAITISEYNKQFLLELGINEEKIKVIRCGINLDSWQFTPRMQLREIPKIATLCRLVEKKGVDVLIEALGILRDDGFKFLFEIVGDGPQKKELLQMVAERNLGDITIFRDAMPNYSVPDWFKDIDIFVLACRKEKDGDQDGIPVVLMEAMSVGVPVISTSISGVSELIEDGVSGFLARPNDPVSLSEKIRNLIHNRDHLESITSKARYQIEREFNENINIKKLIEAQV